MQRTPHVDKLDKNALAAIPKAKSACARAPAGKHEEHAMRKPYATWLMVFLLLAVFLVPVSCACALRSEPQQWTKVKRKTGTDVTTVNTTLLEHPCLTRFHAPHNFIYPFVLDVTSILSVKSVMHSFS
eukprot:3853917-Amphidinium_carterae.1